MTKGFKTSVHAEGVTEDPGGLKNSARDPGSGDAATDNVDSEDEAADEDHTNRDYGTSGNLATSKMTSAVC